MELHRLFNRRDAGAANAHSLHAINRLAATERGRTGIATVAGGGPSIHEAARRGQLDEGLLIVCNRYPLDPHLMEASDPSVLVFMDAVLVSPSRAARAFRDSVQHFLAAGDRWVLTFDTFGPALRAGMPPELAIRVLDLPARHMELPATGWNPNLRAEPWLPDCHNVTTSVALPLAATVAGEIRLAGLDGRPPDGEPVSWGSERRRGADQDEWVRWIRTTWPVECVAPAEYDEQYLDLHEETLTMVLDRCEAHGATVRSLTPSFTDAVASRHRTDTRKRSVESSAAHTSLVRS